MQLLKQATTALLGTLLLLGVFTYAETSAQSISRYVIGNGGSLIIDNSGKMTYGGTVGQTIVGVGGYEPGSVDIYHGFWYVKSGKVSVGPGDVVAGERLLWNSPNPVTTSTTIHFEIPSSSTVRLRIYAADGSLVQTLVDGEAYTTGSYQMPWDCTNASGDQVASGAYLYKLDVQPTAQNGRAFSHQQQMLVMK